MGLISRWKKRNALSRLIKNHFAPAQLDKMIVSERKFPGQLRPDLQRGLEDLFKGPNKNCHFTGIIADRYGQGSSLASLASNPDAIEPAAPVYEEVDVGEEAPARCLSNGLWLGRDQETPYAMLLTRTAPPFGDGGLSLQVGVTDPQKAGVIDRLFDRLSESVRASRS